MVRNTILMIGLLLLLGACASPPNASSDRTHAVSGSVSYRERMAMPPGSMLHVAIEDVSRTDAPAIVIAEKTMRTKGQVPLPFTLAYDPDEIDPRHRYTVRAELRGPDGRLMWTTTEHHGVLTRGQPDKVNIILHRTQRQGHQSDGKGIHRYQRETSVSSPPPHHLMFGACRGPVPQSVKAHQPSASSPARQRRGHL